jgi:hypothetical protein
LLIKQDFNCSFPLSFLNNSNGSSSDGGDGGSKVMAGEKQAVSEDLLWHTMLNSLQHTSSFLHNSMTSALL